MSPGSDPHLANMFEDASGVRREGGFFRRISQLETMQDGGIIPGGYGVCWWEWDRAEAICAPMPWHLLIGWAYRTYHALRRGWWGCDARELAAYERGRADGKRLAAFDVAAAHRLDVEHAYNNGVRDQYDYVLDAIRGELTDARNLLSRQKGLTD